MITSAKYIISSPDVKDCPQSGLPEYAFIGRSNVGKSSLINMLCHNPKLAKTSQKRRRKIPEVKVPLVRAAYDIVKRTGLRFDVPLQAYNSLVSQLLRHSGVDREVELYDASREEVVVLHAAPVQVAVPEVSGASVQAMSEVAALSAATARTENIVETVNQVIEAVVGQIRVTPGFAQGECEVKITLKPTVLDGSDILMTSKDGTLTVCVTPATQEASAAAAAALPRLEAALAEHAPAFHHVSVVLALKKGSRNETV